MEGWMDGWMDLHFHYKVALLDWDLVAVEAIIVKSLSCSRHVGFVTWCIILLEVASTRWVHCGHKGMDNNSQVGCDYFNNAQLVPSVPIKHPHIITPQPPSACVVKAGWIHAFMLFMLNFDPIISAWIEKIIISGTHHPPPPPFIYLY